MMLEVYPILLQDEQQMLQGKRCRNVKDILLGVTARRVP